MGIDNQTIRRQWSQSRLHTPGDDMDQTLDFSSFMQLAQLNFLIGYQVANETARPAWNPGDFFGEKFGKH